MSSSPASSGRVLVSRHPLVSHKIRILRDVSTSCVQFRILIKEISNLLGYESSLDLKLVEEHVPRTSPTGVLYHGHKLDCQIGLFPILRAGVSMTEAFLDLIPSAKVLHIGIFREKSTLQPVEYYNKLPHVVNIDLAIILDPLIATAGTAIATVNILKDWGIPGNQIKIVAICASGDGITHLLQAHPDVTVHVGAIDEILNSDGYVVPGLGDAGDRLFNTL